MKSAFDGQLLFSPSVYGDMTPRLVLILFTTPRRGPCCHEHGGLDQI
jgi:hypothetical protein